MLVAVPGVGGDGGVYGCVSFRGDYFVGLGDLRWRFESLCRKGIEAVFESAAKGESVMNMASVATLSCIALSFLPHSRHQMH